MVGVDLLVSIAQLCHRQIQQWLILMRFRSHRCHRIQMIQSRCAYRASHSRIMLIAEWLTLLASCASTAVHRRRVLDIHLTASCNALSVGICRRSLLRPRVQKRMPHLWNLRMYWCLLRRLNRQAPRPQVLRIQWERRAARSKHLSQHIK